MSDNCVKSYSSWNAFFLLTFTAFGLPGACIAHLGIITTSVNKTWWLRSKNNKCSPRYCRPPLQKILGRGSPFNVSYQHCCKKNICSACQDLQKSCPQLKMSDNCVKSYSSWNAFFVDSLLLVTQIIKGKQLYYKMWSSRTFNEKRAITPKWVMGFTLKLQGR
jgi:hypothetical protein